MTDVLFSLTQALTMEMPWFLPMTFALFGACIGSFLNVIIYRMPRGMSVQEPRRSFCPHCNTPIPWYLNLPIVSWLMLRGRSACCRHHIPVRYLLVELACCALFASLSWYFSMEDVLTQGLFCLWAACMLACLCIDWEHMLVLPSITLCAAAAGLLVSLLSPWMIADGALEAQEGLIQCLLGGVGGFVLFRLLALLGRLLFGHRREKYESPRPWTLRQAGDDLELTIGEQSYSWAELFMEQGNYLRLSGATMNGREGKGELRFRVDAVELPDGARLELEDCDSLGGTAMGMATRREAMGSGDAWIALGIGALCGWPGVMFALVLGSFIGLLWALVARIGRGRPMPFGPALIIAAYVWLFYGQTLWFIWLDGMGSLPTEF